MKKLVFCSLSFIFFCQTIAQKDVDTSFFDVQLASELAKMPMHCIPNEWPNKTSHLSDTVTDHVLLPHQLHPSFFGCLDWHSSVHGHWMLVKLLKTFPQIRDHEKIELL